MNASDRSLRDALADATSDVRACVRLLIEQGAAVVRARGGRSESFGNASVELVLDETRIIITRDRGQWMMDLHHGLLPRVDFDVVDAAVNGLMTWPSAAHSRNPEQLPAGVSWADDLPNALDWLRSTPDAAERLGRIQRSRADLL